MSATLFSVVVAYLHLTGDRQPLGLLIPLAIGSLLLLCAGCAGGVIAGHVAHFNDFKMFIDTRLRPRTLDSDWKYATWSSIQHLAFGLGIAIIVVTLFLSTFIARAGQ